MSQLENWKTRKLDDRFLIDLHKILTQETLDPPEAVGRFREDSDDVCVTDRATGLIVHVPPKMEMARRQLGQLYQFANTENDDSFIHPFVKASILHFLIGYIHPFVDGNGRSARALFYWYLMKRNYWIFQFLPISFQIKKREWRPGYDRAFQYVETDEGDLTYFLSYKLSLAQKAIEDFVALLRKKQRNANRLKERLIKSGEINSRQMDLIEIFQDAPNGEIDFKTYKDRNKVVYQTARADLLDLASKRILKQVRRGKKFVFGRGENFPSD